MAKRNIKSALIIAVFSFLIISCGSGKSSIPKADKGILDLSQYNFETEGSIPLDGEWIFCWNELLKPSDICRSRVEYYTVPGSWKTIGNEERSSDGYGTLSLMIYKDKMPFPLALKIPSISSAYKLWINDQLVCENGTVSDSIDSVIPVWLPRVVQLPEIEGNSIQLTLQIANFHDLRDGFWGNIMLGSSNDIGRMRDKSIGFELFLFGALFIMALYHFSIFLLRREDKTLIYFAAICLLLSVRIVTGGECYLTLLTGIPSLIVYKTLFLSFYLSVPIIIMYFIYLYPDEMWSKFRIVAVALFVITIPLIFMPLKIVIGAVIFFQIIALILFIYFTIVLIRAGLNHREGAYIFLAGWIILSLTGVNDILFDLGIIWTGLIAPFGLLFFILSQSFMLSIRYAHAFRTITEMSKNLKSLDKLKDEFLANTSHELKTPLSGIIGLAESLTEGAKGEISEDVRSDLRMIVSSGRRLSFLVNDILDFSKLKNRSMTLTMSQVDINSIINSVLYIVKPLVKSNNVVLKNSIGNEFPLIMGDENRLQQIFYNLIGNAIKFTESGRIEIFGEVKITDKQEVISVSVRDTGIGIEKEKQSTIFDAFRQGDGGISRYYGGTGIGLAITKQLVLLHKGLIDVESEPGTGSTFTVVFPIENDELYSSDGEAPVTECSDYSIIFTDNEMDDNAIEERSTGKDKKNEELYSDQKSTVLIVDDDPVNLQVLENYLTMENYIVIKTRYGLEAIEIIKKDKSIDIVLLDIMMPRVTGYDVTKKIREEFTHFELPIIMITAKNRVSDVVTGIEAGGNDYITKPFDKRELLVRIDSLLKLKASVEQSKKLANIEYELDIAQKIQLSTLPLSVPDLDNMKVAVRYKPMDSIGGDFYSFHVLPENKIGILLTDVTGHGIPAALIASMLKIVSTILSDYFETPQHFLAEMNQMLTGNMGDHFLTAVYILVDGENRQLFHANAGHEPIIILKRHGGIVIEDNPKGRIIGMDKNSNIELSSIKLDSRDRIIMFTDGMTEASNSSKEMMGIESLKKLIFETIDMDAEACADFLVSSIENWIGRQNKFGDDLSLIIIDID